MTHIKKKAVRLGKPGRAFLQREQCSENHERLRIGPDWRSAGGAASGERGQAPRALRSPRQGCGL